MKIVLVDDEPACRSSLCQILAESFPNVQVLGQAASVAEARVLLQLCQPDVLLLDIALGDGTGFDLLDSLPQRPFRLVFTTAHEQFAIRAFRASAIDYLLKPITAEDLQAALDKAAAFLPTPQPHLTLLQQAIQRQRIQQLALPGSYGTEIVPLHDIRYLEADDNYTRFHLVGGQRLLASRTLKDYESILEPEGFFRIHRSYLLNLKQLQSIRQGDTPSAFLKGGGSLEISRRRAPLLMQALKTRPTG